MVRPIKWRRVASIPEITYFKPVGTPPQRTEEVSLSLEEAEAIRLRDLERLEQEQCASEMKISRSTFHRVLESARRKVADALLNGKAIRIEGGDFELAKRRFRCSEGHEWEVPFEKMIVGPPLNCPQCQSPNIIPLQPMPFPSRGWRHRHGRTRHRP
jgi:predicted DNA-binding protein (UPF0251 family)